MDNNTSKHVLELDAYGGGEKAGADAWVLLRKCGSSVRAMAPAGSSVETAPVEAAATDAADGDGEAVVAMVVAD